MAILKILKDPDPVLRQPSLPVVVDKQLRVFMDSLLETMRSEEDTIGIAAIQVGTPIRALIVDIPRQLKDAAHREPVFIINPEVTYLSEETVVLPEDCLSVRNEDGISFVIGMVERPKSIGIQYMDLNGVEVHLSIDGNQSEYDLWFARCLQHELDHLNGILFIDKLVE